jgi:putative ABC transport system substrate-binding protein
VHCGNGFDARFSPYRSTRLSRYDASSRTKVVIMRRRQFIALLGSSAVTWPLAVRAQQPERVRRIGVLMPVPEDDAQGKVRLVALREGLQKLGWVEGRNIQIDYRWAPQGDQLQPAAKELLSLAPELILVQSDPATAALRRETWTIPIVFVSVGDPIGGGFIQSMAGPAANATGFSNFEPSIGGKWLELLKEVSPGVKRALVILQTETPANASFLRAAEAAAPTLQVTLIAPSVHNATEIEAAVNTFAAEPLGGLVVMPHPVTASNRNVIIGLAARHRLPAVYPFRFFAQGGGLVSYGIDQIEHFRRAADYINRILKGEKPGDLPTQASTKFELAVNLKTAKSLGLTIPPALLARADEVIE